MNKNHTSSSRGQRIVKNNHTPSFRGQTKSEVYGLDCEPIVFSGESKASNKKITKAESDEAEIQRLLENETKRLHKEIWSAQRRGDMELFNELSNSWQEKYSDYEKKIRSAGYLDRNKLKVVIIDDTENIRSKICKILPELIGDQYRIEFKEIDNFEDAKDIIEVEHFVSETLDKTFYILDNHFYYDNKNEKIKIDAGIKLYDWLLNNPIIRKKFLENITILSSDKNVGAKFPEGVNIIEGKSPYNNSYIGEISNWIKSIVEK